VTHRIGNSIRELDPVIIARGADGFDVGPIHICAAGEVYDASGLIGARQWCADGTLER